MPTAIEQLTRQLVACESTHNRPKEIARTADIFEQFFGKHVVRQQKRSGSILTVLFVPPNITMPRVLYIGHMDVVPGPATAFHPRKRGDRLYGRGTYDMKGPTAALAVAMRAVLQKNPRASVGLLLTGDEESGGMQGAGAWVQRHARHLPEMVFDPDGGNPFTLVTEAKGVLSLEVRILGKTAHAARPWEGQNALEFAASGITRLQKVFPKSQSGKTWKTTITPTIIQGGIAGNQIPAKVVLRIDVRYVYSDKTRAILQKIQHCFPQATVRVHKQADPFFLPTTAKPIRHLQSCARTVLGKTLPRERYHSSCDARFFSKRGVVVALMRSSGGGAHAADEWVSLRGLEKYAQLVKLFTETY